MYLKEGKRPFLGWMIIIKYSCWIGQVLSPYEITLFKSGIEFPNGEPE